VAKFKCPHCGDEIELKVQLRDVTPSKTLGEGSFVDALNKSFGEAYGEKESPRSESRISKRMEPKDPLSGLFVAMHDELMEKREQVMGSGHISKARDFEEDNSYLSDEKAQIGENIANKMNSLFGAKG
jgi:hypothetical protein